MNLLNTSILNNNVPIYCTVKAHTIDSSTYLVKHTPTHVRTQTFSLQENKSHIVHYRHKQKIYVRYTIKQLRFHLFYGILYALSHKSTKCLARAQHYTYKHKYDLLMYSNHTYVQQCCKTTVAVNIMTSLPYTEVKRIRMP